MVTSLRRFSSFITLSVFLFATFFPSLTPVFAAAGDPVDIAIESASLDEFGSIRMSVKNVGLAEITENFSFDLRYFDILDQNNVVQIGVTQFGFTDDLLPEQIVAIPPQSPDIPEDTDFIRVVLDPNDVIEEDENNNSMDLQIPLPPPPPPPNDPSDIIITSATPNFEWGSMEVTFRNNGLGDASNNFTSRLNFLDESGQNLASFSFGVFDGIAAGGETSVTAFFDRPIGATELVIVADSFNFVSESDESNNTFSLVIPPPPPVQTDSDIIVSEVTRDPVFGTMEVFVRNIGSEGISGAFTVELRFLNDNEELLGSMSSVVDELDADQEKLVIGDFLPELPEGTTVITAVADSENAVLELDETNNTAVLTPLSPLPFLADIDIAPNFDESVFRYTLAMGYEVDAIGFTLRTGNPVVDHFNVFNSQTQESVSLFMNFGAAVFNGPLLVGGNEFIITPRSADDEQLSADGYRLVVTREAVPLTSITSDLNGDIEAPFYSGPYTLTAPFEQSLATFTVESADPSLVFVEPFVNGQAVGVPPANLFAANEPFSVPLGVGNSFVSVLLRNADGAVIGNVGFDVMREPATLAGIGENLADELSPTFSPDERSYTISAVFAESEMTLTLEKEADSSITSYEVFGDTFDINESATIPLQIGGNVVEIRLLSGDGYAGSYFLTATRFAGVNEAPTAEQAEFTGYSGSRALGGQLFGFDPEGDTLTFQVRVFPLNAQLFFFNEGDGSFTYFPDDGFTGEDSFTFMVNDGRNDSAPAPVFLTINPAPVLTSIEENLADDFDDVNLVFLNQIDAKNEESQVTFRPEVSSDAVTSIAILHNGNPPVIIAPGEEATFDLSLFENSFVFTLFIGDFGVSEMIVSVNREGARLSNLAVENFGLSPVFAPTTREYDIFNVPMNTDEISILAESTDPLVTSVRVQGNDSPDPVFAPIGELFQLPVPNFSEGFTLNLYDQDDQLLGSYSLTVTHVLPPTLSSVTENLEAEFDPPFDPETYEYSLTARAGEDNVVLNLQSDRADEIADIRATLIQGDNPAIVDDTLALDTDMSVELNPGQNSVVFELMDANGDMFAAYTFNIRRNRAPIAESADFTMVQGSTFQAFVDAEDPDNLEAILNLRVVTPPAQGNVVFNPNGIFEYAPNADFTGVDSFTVRASDGIDDSAEEATVSITVTPSVRMTSVGENLEADFDPEYSPASFENFISASGAENSVTFVPFMEDGAADTVVIRDEATRTTLTRAEGEEATLDLYLGENIFTFTFSLNNTYVGSQRIIVNREQVMLSSLTENLSGDLTPEFDPSIRDYSLAALPENEEVRFLLESPAASFYQVVTQPGERGQESDGPFDIAAEAVLPLEFEENTFRFDLLDENFDFIGSYTVAVNRPFKTLASLEETSANDLVPAFDPNTHDYTLTLGRNEETATFTFDVAEPDAETFNVVAVVNDFEVVELLRSGDSFTAGVPVGGATRLAVYILNDAGTLMGYYTVTMSRPLSNVSTLASFTENTAADLSPAFDPAVTAYTLNVDFATTAIALTPTATDDLATVTLDGDVELAVGDNIFTVVVTAEDGTTTTYTLTVNRAAEGQAPAAPVNPPVDPDPVQPPAPIRPEDMPRGTSSPASRAPAPSVTPPAEVLGVKLSRLDTLLKKLQRGSKGKSVKELQKLLKAEGYLSKKFSVNGVYGKTTEKAVLRYIAEQEKAVLGQKVKKKK